MQYSFTYQSYTRYIRLVMVLVAFSFLGCSDNEGPTAFELNQNASSLLSSDLNQAKVYAFSALEVADSKEDQFQSYFILGYVENKLGNVGMAISHYMEAIELFPEDSKSIGVRKNLGKIFERLGNHSLAIYHFLQAYDYTQGKDRVEFLILLGKAYMSEGDLNVAGEYFQLAIEESKFNNFSNLLAIAYNLEGLRYKKAGNLEIARKYYHYVTEYSTNQDFNQRVGIAYHNLGNSYLIEGELDKAISYFTEALKFQEKKSEIFLSNMDLGECYLKLRMFKEAESYLMNAHDLYGSFTPDHDDIKLFQHLTELSQGKGDKDMALMYSNKFNSETFKYYETRDKHLQATSIAAVKSFANLYEEGLSNKKVIKKTVYSIWAIAAGGVLSLVLMIMLWLRFVKRKSKMQYELMELIEGL